MDFADSFIASEWNYDVNQATGVLDQTGIIAGYLKSVEQLLYAVIKLSIDKNKIIRLKNGEDGEFNSDNVEFVNSTLGSLTHFVKANGDISYVFIIARSISHDGFLSIPPTLFRNLTS